MDGLRASDFFGRRPVHFYRYSFPSGKGSELLRI
jgi:hypothetical protein